MFYPLQRRAISTAALAIVFFLGALVSGCGNEDETAAQGDADTGGSGESTAESRTGTITIGEQTWTVVASMQCGVRNDSIVMIYGHTAENEEIEVVIDHDPPDLKSAYIQGPDNTPYWIAEDDAIEFDIDGSTVSGSGTFSVGIGGQVEEGEPREVAGSFEIKC